MGSGERKPTRKAEPRSSIGSWLLFAGCLLATATLLIPAVMYTVRQGWRIGSPYLLGTLLFALATLLLRRSLGAPWTSLMAPCLFALALIPRVITMYSMDWLADEIFLLDWINRWFLENFPTYLLQFQHTSYPPKSPVFGHPPLGMWFMTGGMYLAERLGRNYLYGARLVNVVLGSLTCVGVYLAGERFFSRAAGILAALLLAFSPAMISIDAAGYLDTAFGFFLVLDLFFFLHYIAAPNRRTLYLLGFLVGLSVLANYMGGLFFLAVLAYFGLVLWQKRDTERCRRAFTFSLVAVLMPILLWAGARDPSHILKVLDSRHSGFGMIYPIGVQPSTVLYYFAMLVGRTTPIWASLLVLTSSYTLTSLFGWRKELYSGFALGFGLCYVLLVYLFGGPPTTLHRMAPIFPYLALSTGQGTAQIIRQLRQWFTVRAPFALLDRMLGGEGSVYLLVILLAGAHLVVALSWPSGVYRAYNNFLVGGIRGSCRFYRTGDGEGMEQVAAWLRTQGSRYKQVSVVDFHHLLRKYVSDVEVVGHFPHEGYELAVERGSDLLVIHNFYLCGPPYLKITAQTRDWTPVTTIRVAGEVYIEIYELPSGDKAAIETARVAP